MVFDGMLNGLLAEYWPLGALVIGFLSSAILFLPSPAFILIFVAAKQFDPFWLGLLAGIGAAIGELIAYYAGYIGKDFLLVKYEKQLTRLNEQFQKRNPMLVIFGITLTPFPFDVVGIFCGLIKYPVQKFFIPLLAGKIIKFWVIAYAGYLSIDFISQFIGA